jgi:hypothetical protein
MGIKKIIVLLIFGVNYFSFGQNIEPLYKIDGLIVDASFAGGRLNKFEKQKDDLYNAYIFPENEPVNESPWYSFSISSKQEKIIQVALNYGAYKHRYIPKISTDKVKWTPLDTSKIAVDSVSGIATLQLKVSPQKIYVSAQEIESSEDTYLWMDKLLERHSQLKKVIAGTTGLNKDNYCLEFENKNVKNSIVLIARQHPPEITGGSIGFKAFFETLLSDSDIAKAFRDQFNIYAFPLFNPDGADMGNWRHNANGVDLNRDWVDFKQPETKMAKMFFENKIKEGHEIKFAVDFHASYSGPYLLVLDSINEMKTKRIIPTWLTNIERNSEFRIESRRRSQELPYCYNYFYNQLGSEAVTYEEGDEIDRNIIRKRAQVYATQLMKTLIEKFDKKE